MKVKSHRGAAKRFKKTSTGKFKRASANKSHILTKKEPKRKRRLKKSKIFSSAEAPRIKRMLPYD